MGPARVDLEAQAREIAGRTAAALRRAMAGNAPPESTDLVQVRFGRPARVVVEAARELDAGLIVLGGKRHDRLDRWLAGSTVHAAMRISPVPVLAVTESIAEVNRLLVAVDLSAATPAVLDAARGLAGIMKADLRLVHAIDLPHLTNLEVELDVESIAAAAESRMVKESGPGTDGVVRRGRPLDIIREEVREWKPDIVVVGTHGHGAVDRYFLGSVAEQLLQELPASLLAVPVGEVSG
jgi:nucleotide-binding universal stress UspA family protein